MNIASIVESLGKLERRVFAVAEHAITFVRQAYGNLSGDEQHAHAVELLRRALPTLEKWAAHMLVAVVYGWIKKNLPAKLQPESNFTLDESAGPDELASMRVSPFAEVAPGAPAASWPPPPPPSEAQAHMKPQTLLQRIVQPSAPSK